MKGLLVECVCPLDSLQLTLTARELRRRGSESGVLHQIRENLDMKNTLEKVQEVWVKGLDGSPRRPSSAHHHHAEVNHTDVQQGIVAGELHMVSQQAPVEKVVPVGLEACDALPEEHDQQEETAAGKPHWRTPTAPETPQHSAYKRPPRLMTQTSSPLSASSPLSPQASTISGGSPRHDGTFGPFGPGSIGEWAGHHAIGCLNNVTRPTLARFRKHS